MKLRNIYLILFVASLITLLKLSTNVQPDAKVINLFGYAIGINFTNYLWVKIIGFASICLYIINPKKIKA